MGLTLNWNSRYGRSRAYGVSGRGALLSSSSRKKAGLGERFGRREARRDGWKAAVPARKSAANGYRQPAKPAVLPRLFWTAVAALGMCVGVFKRALIIGVLLTLFIGMSIGLLAGYRFMSESQYFALNRVVIEGTQRLESQDVLDQAGVAMGQNVVGVNLAELEARLRQNPWVRSVRIKRMLPDGLSFFIEERPAAFWLVRGETIYYADDRAEPIAPVGNDRFASLPTVEVEPGCDECVARLKDFLGALEGSGLFLGRKEAVGFRAFREEGLTVFHEVNNVALTVGLNSWKKDMGKVSQVWADLARRGELQRVKSIQAGGEKVFVRMNQAVPQDQAPAAAAAPGKPGVGLD